MKQCVFLVVLVLLAAGCGEPSPQVATGRQLFQSHGCAACHGPEGGGDGPVSATLKAPPPNLQDPSVYRGGTSEIEIAETLRTGVSDTMPSYVHIPVEERLEIARYLIGLQGGYVAPSGGAAGGEAAVSHNERKLQTFELGGDFQLTDQDGQPFRLGDTRGKIKILFFGYTSCPDFCPMTLSKVSQIRKLLGASGEELMTLFVSVDPERDTPAKLQEYLGFFALGNAVAVTGSREEVDKVLELYKASYHKKEGATAAGYLVDHTTYLYLVDRENAVRALFNHFEAPEHVAMGIRVLLRDQPPPGE